jgi:hypothetical protein
MPLSVQRIVLAALGPEAIRKTKEIFLVDRTQQGDSGSLDDFVFESSDRERALPAIRLRNVLTP